LEESKELTLKIPVPKGASRVSESQLEVLVDVTPAPEEEPVPDESAQAGQTDEKTEVKTTAREFAGVNVEVKGLAEEDRFSFTQPDSGQVLLTVKGESSYIDTLTASDFEVYVDASA
ncbi:hypothetical protein JQK62_24470, partial [Leptospira santarosai]|nr:hypothetical protein [Leptospira santarosai]